MLQEWVEKFRLNRNFIWGSVGFFYVFVLLLILYQDVSGDMNVFSRVVASSLFYASLYFMVAAGLSIVFGLMDVLNLAQGALVTLGAFIGFYTLENLPQDPADSHVWTVMFIAINASIIAAALEAPVLNILKRQNLNAAPLYERRGNMWQRMGIAVLVGAPISILCGIFLVAIEASNTLADFAAIFIAVGITLLAFYDGTREFITYSLKSIGETLTLLFERGVSVMCGQPAAALQSTPAKTVDPAAAVQSPATIGLIAIVLAGLPALFLTLLEQRVIHLGLALVAAMFAGAVAGIIMERFFIRPTYSRPLYQIVLTLGLGLLIVEAIEANSPQGTEPVGTLAAPVDYLPAFMRGTLAGTSIQRYWVFMILIGVVMVIAVQLILQYTRIGMIIRAGVQDSEMVEALGINVRLVFTMVFALGAAIAALGGITAGGFIPISPFLGDAFLLQAITVIIIGGLGSYVGTAVAAVIVGVTRQVSEHMLFEEYGGVSRILILLLLAVFLLVKPTGLFGKEH